jgi:hypothetical protein
MPSRWRSRIIERSKAATAPMMDSIMVAIGLSSPVKVRDSFWNVTLTPLPVKSVTSLDFHVEELD